MLVMENGYHRRGPPSTTSTSILDSPTLARVERARLRHEQEEQNGNNSPLQCTLSSYCPVSTRKVLILLAKEPWVPVTFDM